MKKDRSPNPMNQIKVINNKTKFVLKPVSWLRDWGVQELEKQIGSGEFKFINDELQKTMYCDQDGFENNLEYEYCGNLIVANEASAKDLFHFKTKYERMCCGIFKFKTKLSPNGCSYVIAFDYGH